LPSPKEFVQVGVTFTLVTIGWVFFRSESIVDSFVYLKKMVFQFYNFQHIKPTMILFGMGFIILEFIIKSDERDILFSKRKEINYFLFLLLGVLTTLLFFKENINGFIYFQF